MFKFILIPILFSFNLFAVTYNYDQIVKKALTHNYKLKEIQEQIYQADLLIEKSYTFLQPTIDLGGRFTINDEEKSISMMPGTKIVTQEKYIYSGSATLNYTLLNMRAFPLVKVARKSKEISTFSKEMVQQSIKYSIGEIYINILSLQDVIKVNELSIKNLEEHLKTIEARIELRDAIEIEKLRTEVEIAKVKTQIQQTQGTIEQMKSLLATMMGEANYDFEIENISFESEVDEFGKIYNTAKSNRIENKISFKQIEIEKLILDNVYAKYYPTIMMQGTYNWTSNTTTMSPEHDAWAIHFLLNFSLYDGGIRRQEIKEEKSKIIALNYQMENFNDTLKQEIKNILIEMKNIDLTIEKIQKEKELAQKNLELTEESYKLGVSKNIDIIDATHVLNLINLNETVEKLKKNLSFLKFKKAIGKL